MLHFSALTYIYVLRMPLLGLSGLTLRELWFVLVFHLSVKTTICLIEMSHQIMPHTSAAYSKYVQNTMSNHDRFARLKQMDHVYVSRYGVGSQNWLELNVLCLEISVLGGWRAHLTDWNFTVALEESDHHMGQSAPFQRWLHSKAQKGKRMIY